MKRALFLLLLAGLADSVAYADDAYINLGAVSYHFGDRNYNNTNVGFGVELPAGKWLIGAGIYRNSIDRTSRYLVAERCIIGSGRVQLCGMAGGVDGYHLNGGGIIPMVAPTLRIAVTEKIHLRTIFIPEIDDKTAAVVSLQVRLKIS